MIGFGAQHGLMQNNDEILRTIEPIVHSIGLRILGREDEDACQDCLLHIWRNVLPKYDGSRGIPLEAFIVPCIRNFMRSRRRQYERITLNLEPLKNTIAATPDAGRIDALAADILRQPSQYFPPREAHLMTHHYPDMTCAEAAHVMGVSTATAWRTLNDIRARLIELTGVV